MSLSFGRFPNFLLKAVHLYWKHLQSSYIDRAVSVLVGWLFPGFSTVETTAKVGTDLQWLCAAVISPNVRHWEDLSVQYGKLLLASREWILVASWCAFGVWAWNTFPGIITKSDTLRITGRKYLAKKVCHSGILYSAAGLLLSFVRADMKGVEESCQSDCDSWVEFRAAHFDF